jgi:CRISPR/Cas system-associated exonuclease Cas4 (RecB family)
MPLKPNKTLMARDDLFRTKQLEKHLEAEHARRATEHPRWEEMPDYKVPKFWPSSAGDCRRKLCYELLGPEFASPDAIDGAMRMYDGEAHEKSTIHWLQAMGYNVEGVQVPLNKLVKRRGEPLYRISGRMDGVIWLPDADDGKSWYRAVLEIKGLSTFTCKQDALQIVNPGYRDQAHMYMHLAQLRHALFVIKDKNNSELHFIELQIKEDRVKELRARLKQVALAVQKKVMLPRDYSDPNQRPCSWCNFRKECWKKR